VDEHGPLSLKQLLAVAVQAAEGMRAAHAQDVLHRDLKPANLLVQQEGDMWKVKVIDFGLALRQQIIETSRVWTGATQKSMLEWSVAGTLDYAPPEQLGKLPGVPPGPFSDAYAFSRTCCYALFKATELRRKQWDSLPGPLADLLEGCLDPDPWQRPAGFEPVLAVLGECTGAGQDKRLRENEERLSREQEQEQRRQLDADLWKAEQADRTTDVETFLRRTAPSRGSAWRAAAEAGSAGAQWLFGVSLAEGIGESQDNAQALHWLRRAAEQGHAAAQNAVGCMYRNARVVVDHTEALRWFRKAADQGHAAAQNNIGCMYRDGQGVPVDHAEALRWFRKAADQGNAAAKQNLDRLPAPSFWRRWFGS
jgi:hypothetical protein